MPTTEDLGFSRYLRRENADIEQQIVEVQQVIPDNAIAFEQTQAEVVYEGQNQQSSNFVSGSTGWQIKGDGSVEFSSGIFRGTLTAGSIHIPDQNTTASSFHVNTSGDAWWGCTHTNFTANNENAAAYVLADGTFKFSSGKIGLWNIGNGAIYTGTEDHSGYTANQGDITLWSNGTDASIHGRYFYISTTGQFYCTSASISGTVTASSGTIGGWTLSSTGLTATGIKLDSGNKRITVGASNEILIDGTNKKIVSSNYVSGTMGAGFHLDSNLLEVGNTACRGIIRTAVFQKDIVSAMGGNFLVLDADVLDANMTAADNSTLTIEGNTDFVAGDILRIKNDSDDEWLEVTNTASAPTYTVTRDKGGDYAANTNPVWTIGSTVVNYGKSGDGGVYMTASETNAPYLSVFDHEGSPWNTINTRLRLGNLNGYLGYSTDLYGIAIGETDHYLKYDTTNGLRIKGNITIENPGDINASDINNDEGWVTEGGNKVFTVTPTTPYHVGDLWTNGTDMKRCNVERLTGAYNAADWGLATAYTNGATWGTNLGSIPAYLGTPSGAGLYLGATNLGYYSGSVWKTYMDNSGNFYLGGSSGAFQWDAGDSTLMVGNPSDITKQLKWNGTDLIINGSYFSNNGIYGDGSDGDLSTSGTITLTRDTYYNNLTVNAGHNINTAGYRLFVKGTLTISATSIVGRPGGVGGNGNNGNDGTGSNGTGGTGGTAASALADGFFIGALAGVNGVKGGDGRVDNHGQSGGSGSNGSNTTNSLGSNGVNGSNGGLGGYLPGHSSGGNGGTGGTKGTRTIATVVPRTFTELLLMRNFDPSTPTKYQSSASSGGSGAGGSGAAFFSGTYGGGGGGSGASGGVGGIS